MTNHPVADQPHPSLDLLLRSFLRRPLVATYGHGACTPFNTETMGKSSTLGFSFHFSTDNQSQSTPTTGRPSNDGNHSGPTGRHLVSRATTRASHQHQGCLDCALWSPQIGRWQNSPAPPVACGPLGSHHQLLQKHQKSFIRRKKKVSK